MRCISVEHFVPIHTHIENTLLEGRRVLRIIKKDKVDLMARIPPF